MKSSFRVILIANGFQPHYIQNLANGLAKNGVGVELLGSDLYDFSRLYPGVKFLNIRGSHDERVGVLTKIQRVLAYYGRLWQTVAGSQARAVHIQWLRLPLIDGVLWPLVFGLMGKRVVYTAHNVLPHDRDTWLNRVVFLGVYHAAHHLVAHSEPIRQRLIREFRVSPQKISKVAHGVYEPLNRPEVDRSQARQGLGLNDDDFVLLFFGNLAPYKGFDLLCEAVSSLESAMPRLRLVVAGRLNPDYRAAYEALKSRYSLSGIIDKAGEYLSDEDTECCFKAADAVVLPYREGSQSGVLFLAYAYGRPVIASDVGSFRDDIVSGKTGLVFENGNPTALRKAIECCAESPWSENDIQVFARKNYSWESVGRDLIEIYQGGQGKGKK